MTTKRALTPDERSIMMELLTAGPFPGAAELIEQAPSAIAVAGPTIDLDLEVDPASPVSAAPHGPVPSVGVVTDDAGESIGDIRVWVVDGRLAGLEYSWYTDDMPTVFPPPERVRVQQLSV